jgi:DtxR family Mn-dependent transcriptional regulator
MASVTVENYVKTIWLEQQQEPSMLVPMGRVAAVMGVTPGTATTMAKTLEKAGLVKYEPRDGIRLTSGGEQLAMHVLRRHRLVELFLVQILGLDWSEVHEEADQWEHVISDRVLDRMDELLGFPRFDPHGDPIPDAAGALHEVEGICLTEAREQNPFAVSRIVDQDPEFLQFIDRVGLTPGTPLKVVERDRMAEAVKVKVNGDESLTLGYAAAAKIMVTQRP